MRNLLITIINQSLVSEGIDCVLDIFLRHQGLDFFDYYQLVILELSKSFSIEFVQDRLIEFIYLSCFVKEFHSSLCQNPMTK